jgi:hypothetical protein
VKNKGRVALYSRRKKILNKKFDYIADALDFLPDETVIDEELVAVGPDGKPNFNLLQNFRSSEAHIIFYAFDILIHKGRDLMSRPLAEQKHPGKTDPARRSRGALRGVRPDGNPNAEVREIARFGRCCCQTCRQRLSARTSKRWRWAGRSGEYAGAPD